ncbi:hypothetical protein IP84_07040 [beta proteobacterium AAP99]|nr:hypothetical protein IP84_07040 [beta proteobacterium AAP99]
MTQESVEMSSIFKVGLITAALALLCSTAWANPIATTGQITNLRIEGATGFIGFTPNWQPAGTCGVRVWVDMRDPVGRAMYATAMSAFSNKQVVLIRAFESSPRVFNECQLYDIFIPNPP